jgi:hypothetical protein
MAKIAGVGPLAVQYARDGSWGLYHQHTYEMETEAELIEAMTPNGQGWMEMLPRWRRLRRATFRWHDSDDDSFYPPLGLREGMEISIAVRRGWGDQGQWIVLYYTTVQRLNYVQTTRTAAAWQLTTTGGQVMVANAALTNVLENLYSS